jgi:hypothetical protein
MHSFFFWKIWLREYRLFWYIAAGLFFFSLAFMWFSYVRGADGVIEWEKLQEQKAIESTVHTFRLGPFELNVPAESYVIFEYFNGSNIIPDTFASYLYLALLVISAVTMLTVISTIERFWYFIAMALFILFIVSLRFEVLGIFGIAGRLPVALILVLFIVPSFYFNRLRPHTSFLTRLITFLVITSVIAVVIRFYSSVPLPFYHLTLTSYTAALVLAVLFMITVAHEILAGFVYIVSQGTSRNLQHLSIISALYFFYVLITGLHEMGVIQWNLVYINLFVLLTISAILGIWGFRQREIIYGNILSFYPFGAYFFLALGTICFATIAHLAANANDPALKILRDMIIFSHIGYGLIFITYLFSNFILMLARSIPIHKVLYNPTRMPYFTFRFAGLIVVLAFVFISNWRQYVYHGYSGFYNIAGDLYTLLDNEAYALSFYEQGRTQGFENHRSNYALGRMKTARYNFEAAQYHYQLANGKRPTEYSLTNHGNVYLWQNDFFGAIRTYRKSLQVRPESGILANNLGLAYTKIHKLDSAIYFFNAARQTNTTRPAAETNFFAMAAQEMLPLNADSVLRFFNTTSTATTSNALALATLFNEPFTTTPDPLASKRLNLFSATLLNNYIIKNAKTLDTTFVNRAYAMASDSLNADYSEALKASLAYAYYHHGNIAKALDILGELAFLSQSYQGKFNYLMGLWALEQNNPILASSYFEYADLYDYKQGKFYYAISRTEEGNIPKALAAWDSVTRYSQDAGEKAIAARIKELLTLPLQRVTDLKDADKYQFCRYRISLKDSLVFNRIIDQVQNDNYKALALLDYSRKFFEADQMVPAIRYYNRIAGLRLTDKALYDQVQHFELQMLAYRRETRLLATQINTGITFNPSQFLEKLLYTALIREENGDLDNARKLYSILGRYNPYFEEGIIAAANFYKQHHPEAMTSYTLLAEALHVNAYSIRLLKAYHDEALRRGFDDYARNAAQRLKELQQRL